MIIRCSLVGAAIAGCGGSSGGGTEGTGTVTVALATTASDGATYTFPTGTVLEIVRTSPPFDAQYPLDGPETVLTETVPTGTFIATLVFPNGTPQLVRTLNGMSQTVSAVWTDPQPVTFDVQANMTTTLVLHFTALNVGDVTFQVGQFQVSIDVTPTTTTTLNHGQGSGDITVTSQQFASGSGLQTLLGLTVGETDSFAMTFDVTTAFAPSSPQQACASATPTQISVLSGSAAFSALVEELNGTRGGGVICVLDRGADDLATFLLFRDGAAPADQQTILPGSNYRFHWRIQFHPGDAYDGITLKLSQLAGPIDFGPATQTTWQHDIVDLDAGALLEVARGNLSTGTIQMTP